MSETAQPAGAGPRKTKTDRWVKLGFLLALLVAGGVIFYLQLRGPQLGWPKDLDKALAQAKAENRRVLVFVRSFPVGDDDKWMVTNPLAKGDNLETIKSGGFIRVELVLDKSAPWARKYGVTKTPTMLIIAPDGQKFHRREGKIGEVPFRKDFLTAPLTENGELPTSGPAGSRGSQRD